MANQIEQLQAFQDKYNDDKEEQNKLLGNKEALLHRLSTEFDTESIKKAKKILDKFEKTLTNLQDEFDEVVLELKEKYGWE